MTKTEAKQAVAFYIKDWCEEHLLHHLVETFGNYPEDSQDFQSFTAAMKVLKPEGFVDANFSIEVNYD